MARYKFKNGVPAFIEIWKLDCKKRGGPPPFFDEDGRPLGDDPRITAVSVWDVAVSPELQARVVNKRELRATLRQLIAWGHPVVV
jgi:hypothetical protein